MVRFFQPVVHRKQFYLRGRERGSTSNYKEWQLRGQNERRA